MPAKTLCDLESSILHVKVCWVAVHVGGLHLLAAPWVRDTLPGCQVLPAQVVAALPVPVPAPVLELHHDALAWGGWFSIVCSPCGTQLKTQATVRSAPGVGWVIRVDHLSIASCGVLGLGPEIWWIRLTPTTTGSLGEVIVPGGGGAGLTIEHWGTS